ncbi:B-cell linker protein isoform X2 [Salarias fasciatus]|uniref:B-cell linker protein-like n=1 Tax=Salarias fasciatus TaxID=181472 RepID=A0A672JE41_SALFA|nr:B-cell linker protein-like isoform X2 [Salarias fasciatus]
MSFFGKLKNLHSGPPAPPRRTDNNADFGWPQDEFDDDDGDMYEVPPCPPGVNIPQRQVEENPYLGNNAVLSVNGAKESRRMSECAHPSRPSKPPKPQPRSDFPFEPNTKKPPKIDRNEKPGRKKVPPVPVPVSEEDVYLDPNVEEENNDDVYLEPTEACTPPPPGPKRMPLPPNTTALSAPKPIMKPPVPRATSNSFLPSTMDLKTAPAVQEKRAAFPIKHPPVISVKPALSANQREVKLGNPNPPMPDAKPVVFPNGMRMTKQSGYENREWFAGNCSRKTAEDLLEKVNKDGAFLIRHSSAQSVRQPYTLAVLYQQKVYNVPIRFLEDAQGYALGKEGKKSEEIFPSLDEMVSHHEINQLLLIDSKSQAKHTAHLIHPVRP